MKSLYGLLFLVSLLLCFTACTPAYYGYGVLLWSENNNVYKNGDIINILSSSKLNESFEIPVKDNNLNLMIPWWRIEFFKSRNEAKKYAEKYKPFVNMYVYSTREGIPPVREKIGNDSTIKILYKFKENEVAKVLSRSKEKSTVGNLEGYWYHVLLQNNVPIGSGKFVTVGIKGYCFGYYLQVTDSGNSEDIALNKEQDPGSNDLLQTFFTGNWRPMAFQDMLDTGMINLEKFNPGWGIFPDKENRKISIVLEKSNYTAEYKEIVQINDNTYTFPDSNLKIEMLSPNRLSATYKTKDTQMNIYFANIKVRLEDIIKNEKERRNEIYKQFYAHGHILSSSVYGEIELKENREFTWTGFDKLIPMIIPREINGLGVISFNYYLSISLQGKYNGVITFSFNEFAPQGGINFLFQFVENGVKLYYIDNSIINEGEVNREGSNQFIIFFNFKE